MLRGVLVIAVTLLYLPLAAAQFGNFFNNFPFGGGHHDHRQQQHAQPRREHRGWDLYHEVPCRAGYVCPGALVCVPTPADCPCPYPEDTKCVIPDDRERDEGEGPPFVCVRNGESCEEVDRFARPI